MTDPSHDKKPTEEASDSSSMDSMNHENESDQLSKSRRTLLRAIGGVTGAGLLTGTVSAHEEVYPGLREQSGTDRPVEELVSEMTLDEKIKRVHNHLGPLPDFSTGYMSALSRLNIPDFRMGDGPVGVRHPLLVSEPNPREIETVTQNSTVLFVNSISGGPSTAFPCTVNQASTWNTDLMYEFGRRLASEAKAKDQDVLFAPALNIVRVPELGRAFEYFGEDPHLTGQGAAAVVEGIQSMGVVATAKHFVANNQEDDRMIVSADVGERALREIYLPGFKTAVQDAEVGSVMAAYNRINGTFATENERLLTDVLKDEWGFEGYVISDYGAINDGAAAANAGTDFDGHIRQVQEEHFGSELRQAVENGEVPEVRIDDMVERILGQSDRFGVLEDDQEGPPGQANTTANQQFARRLAAESGVLLKNEAPGLPLELEDIDSIAVIGPDADKAKTGGGGSSNITTPPGTEVSPVEGIRQRAAPDAAVTYTTGDAREDAVALARISDVSVVVATGDSTEQTDRENVKLPYGQNELISDVAAASEHTIVVLRTGGPVVMPWVDSVSAVLEMWYPGMKDGAATADLLFGDVNPSGKLPLTFGKSREDYPATEPSEYPGVDRGDGYPVAEYTEGIFVGYRWFDQHGIEPLFPFGHGLSYTEFEYGDVEVTPKILNPRREGVRAQIEVENTGNRDGADVVQAYIADQSASVDRPPKELKAFEKVELLAGESTTVEFSFDADNLAFYDVEEEGWSVESGEFEVLVGRSSRDIRARATFRASGGI